VGVNPAPLVAAALLAAALPALPALGQENKGADAEITFNTGLTHLREGRLEMAVESFKKAIKQDPKNPYFHKGLGVAYSQLAARCPQQDQRCRQANLDDAVAASRKALELNPYYVDARNDLGTWLLLAGKREEGKRELLAAYEDPTNPTPEHTARNLGQAYFEEKNYIQAQIWFQTAIQRNKNYPDAYLSLAGVLVAQSKAAETVALLEEGEKATAENPEIVLALGQAYYRAGRFSDARQRWQGLAAKDPGGSVGRRALELLKTLER
jgi:Tfp pilus assembly protein PilF